MNETTGKHLDACELLATIEAMLAHLADLITNQGQATTDTDTGHQADHHTDTESLPRVGAGPPGKRMDCGYFGARQIHAENF